MGVIMMSILSSLTLLNVGTVKIHLHYLLVFSTLATVEVLLVNPYFSCSLVLLVTTGTASSFGTWILTFLGLFSSLIPVVIPSISATV